ncbi:hypothetical protein [Pediococcus damnosus]|uniref:hypothetical protein n=1 Tax=Pediococcus damnosus TaxID=51663 RepID=UPI0011A2B784|nr:hypothetical protein [Pediococcus damnosus]
MGNKAIRFRAYYVVHGTKVAKATSSHGSLDSLTIRVRNHFAIVATTLQMEMIFVPKIFHASGVGHSCGRKSDRKKHGKRRNLPYFPRFRYNIWE